MPLHAPAPAPLGTGPRPDTQGTAVHPTNSAAFHDALAEAAHARQPAHAKPIPTRRGHVTKHATGHVKPALVLARKQLQAIVGVKPAPAAQAPALRKAPIAGPPTTTARSTPVSDAAEGDATREAGGEAGSPRKVVEEHASGRGEAAMEETPQTAVGDATVEPPPTAPPASPMGQSSLSAPTRPTNAACDNGDGEASVSDITPEDSKTPAALAISSDDATDPTDSLVDNTAAPGGAAAALPPPNAGSSSDKAANSTVQAMIPAAGTTQSAGTAAQTQQPSPAAPASVPPSPPTIQVGVSLLRSATGLDPQVFSLQLRPEHLGAVDVRLELDRQGHASAVFTAEHADTLHLLRQDAHHLVAALKQAGLDADSSSLSFSLKDARQEQAGFGQEAGQNRKSAGRNGGHLPITPTVEAAAIPPVASNRLYDLHA